MVITRSLRCAGGVDGEAQASRHADPLAEMITDFYVAMQLKNSFSSCGAGELQSFPLQGAVTNQIRNKNIAGCNIFRRL
jgi:hypothetical protein